MCVHMRARTHTRPSRYTSETCQQVIIFHADGSELLGAFQLHSLFKLRFLSLHLFLNPGALGQQTGSALPVLPLLAPIKNCCPELYNFQSKHERYFTTQPCPGAELSYLSVKSVQPSSYSFYCILLAKHCLSRHSGAIFTQTVTWQKWQEMRPGPVWYHLTWGLRAW